MIFIEKTSAVPASLEVEKQKKNGSYRKSDVLELLKSDFKNKCYICGCKEPKTINVEHFRPHRNNIDLKFDWNNLFWACGHCNNLKNDGYANILNCTDPADNIEERLRYIYQPFYPIDIEALDNDPQTLETRDLLLAVYNGSTDLKKIEADNIKNELIKEFHALFDKIIEYKKCDNEEDREYIGLKIKNLLSRNAQFTAFKRSYIKNSNIYEEFKHYID